MRKRVSRLSLAIVLTGLVSYLAVMLGNSFDMNKNLLIVLAALATLTIALVVELWRRGRKPFSRRET